MFRRLLFSIILPAIASTVCSWALNSYTDLKAQNWLYSIVLFLPIFLISNLYFSKKRDPAEFMKLVFAATIIKFFVALVAIVAYTFYDFNGALPFAVHFILTFILFSIFEIRYLSQLVTNKTNNKP
jgi:hypothetical protein